MTTLERLTQEFELVRRGGCGFATSEHRPIWMSAHQWHEAQLWLRGCGTLTDPELIAGVQAVQMGGTSLSFRPPTRAASWAYSHVPSLLVHNVDQWNTLVLDSMDIGL